MIFVLIMTLSFFIADSFATAMVSLGIPSSFCPNFPKIAALKHQSLICSGL